MDRLLATNTATVIQALFEAINAVAADMPAPQQAKVEKALARAQGAKAAIMAELMG